MKNTKVNCPKCAHSFVVEEVLYKQLNDELESNYNQKFIEIQKELNLKTLSLEKEREAILKQKDESELIIKQGIRQGLSAELTVLEERLRNQIIEENSVELSTYKNQLQQKAAELKEFNKTKTELALIKMEKDELKEKIEAEAIARYSAQLTEEKNKIRRDVENNNQLKISEKDHVIDSLKEQMKILNRKLEQGSMQLQGEVQEIALEK